MALDTGLFFLLNGFAGQSPVLDGIIVFFASTFAYIVVAAFIVLVAFSVYSRREKIEIVLVTLAAAVVARLGVVELIRHYYHRPRPFAALAVHQLLGDANWSFPSGHAAFFFAIATALYLYNKRWGTLFFVAATLITVSRVIAGVHYPSDILGGALLGAVVGYAAVKITHTLALKAAH
jgi:undecaprenyl-diphosphatase